jgi:hypothetical protein
MPTGLFGTAAIDYFVQGDSATRPIERCLGAISCGAMTHQFFAGI